MSDLLIELLNATLVKRPLNEDFFRDAAEADWQLCYDMAWAQNVLAMTFPAMSSLPKELRPSLLIWAQWMAYAQSIAEQTQYKRQEVEKIGSWLFDDGLSTLILKGFSLSALYPNPNLREFSDIDIFSGDNYEAVNACFAKHGVLVDSVDGHHAYLKIDGISVEHHFAFHNTKVKRGLEAPEEKLQQMALQNWQPTPIKGICFPNPAFTALFVGWHAYEHFLQEKIQLRHIIDWALALKKLSTKDAETLKAAKGDSRWGRFMDTMTAIAIHQLNLPQQCFPLTELEAAKTITLEQEQKVWNDIINTVQTQKSKSSNLRRIYIAKRMLKNNWKYKTYSNMSACQLVLNETIAHFRAKRQKNPKTSD